MGLRMIMPFAALALFGCVSAGTNFDPRQVSALSAGLTESQVIERLGKPNARSFMQDGSHVLVWSYARGTAFGAGNARNAALLFDPQKRFVRVLSVAESRVR